eukprot:CAMPEP_0113554096 /NCGR_PEP_ID=MMETSP0015_2-20120614/15964_1 /TAXON_ID=2838 /ORGANISM="Odontella" /LENGTH=670 /DNA_ID=CAMNT_0000455209 /DNA_START=119 /DNA_END=2131 /DNA_ORIENTATION=+ /assembly_acc=CAM_ASM_000160
MMQQRNRGCGGSGDDVAGFEKPLRRIARERAVVGRRRLPFASFLLSLGLLSSPIKPAGATVTLLKEGSALPAKRYPSRPALFGNKFEFGLEYVSRLQVLQLEYDDGSSAGYDIDLCGDQGDEKRRQLWDEGDDDGGDIVFDAARNFRSSVGSLESFREKSAVATSAIGGAKLLGAHGKIINPNERTPVALLARRGKCSYEAKARAASSILPNSNVVRYVVVYDDRPEHKLVDMLPDDYMDDSALENDPSIQHVVTADGVTVGLVFVSLSSGQDLVQAIRDQTAESRSRGGPRILLDGYADSSFPSAIGSPLTWIVGILLLLAGFSCCSCLFTLRSERSDQGDGENATVQRRRRDVILLTVEEVRTLPEVSYRANRKRRGGYVPPPELGGTDCADSKSGGIEMSEQSVHNSSAGPPLGLGEVDGVGLGEQPLLPQQGDVAAEEEEEEDYLDDGCCTICIEEYEEGDRLRVLPCRHAFHSDCIMPWLTERSPTCPLCKAEFEAVGGEEEEEEASDGEGGNYEDPDAGARDIFGLNLNVSEPVPDGQRTVEFGAGEVTQDADEGGDGDGGDDRQMLGDRNPSSTGFFRFLSGRIGSVLGRRSIPEEGGEGEEARRDLEEPLLTEEGGTAEEEGQAEPTAEGHIEVEEGSHINVGQERTGDERLASNDATTASV